MLGINSSKYPEPLPMLWDLFKLICVREKAHGIPLPKLPELLERRASKPADDSLAKCLLMKQHTQAEALTLAFYKYDLVSLLHVTSILFFINFTHVLCYFHYLLHSSTHIVEEEGEFVAYKMCRTLVTNPTSYVGLSVEKTFDNGLVYKGSITEYYDHKQWWRVQFEVFI